jgi:hypothetical protein
VIAPARWATATLALATSTLPGGCRARYRQEFTAELQWMTREEQLRHVADVVMHIWALRAALAEFTPATKEDGMTMFGKLLCRVGVHRWVTHRNPENAATYLKCDRCRKEKDTVSMSDYYGGA